MQVKKVKKRNILFSSSPAATWDLNMHLIMGDKNNYVVDTGLGPLSAAPIKEYIKHDSKPLIVINTHHHWDHVWGNSLFKGAVIVSHMFCREMIMAKWEEMRQKNSAYICGELEMYLPNLVFEKEIYFPEDKVRIIYTPGHTRDSISVLDEEEGVINAGDNIGDNMNEILPSLYGDLEDYRETLFKYSKMDFDTCISGHNQVLKKDVIQAIRDLL